MRDDDFRKYAISTEGDADDKYIAWEYMYQRSMKRLSHSKKGERVEPLQQTRYKPNISVAHEGF
jgi:hypothetical protein